ncbi:hypothetical protein CLHUN_18150 [Ruminiclostridium hungatei]|uniref:CXXX repeat peptide modification system protein n=1 Tax=Ruminiclostridium hungatei TaxID=48256 RepID=A0A1V4SM05_RUMHU|nr:CXXX repeat peptide modification system protein [Ruminiclostridium hungatei]OPX44261.1 hypothetical protein CLHUN_18150 [Ruminiclostridium hungatei]
MHSEKVGMVTQEEKNRVMSLHERILGLEELLVSYGRQANIQEEKDELYERLVTDIGATKLKLQNWWDDMYCKYHWKSLEGCNWHIDFQTNEIFLDKNTP